MDTLEIVCEALRGDLIITPDVIEEVYNYTWGKVDKLKETHQDSRIFFIDLNEKEEPIKEDVKRTTFAFNYAVAATRKDELTKIEELIKELRSIRWDTTKDRGRVIKLLNEIDDEVKRFPHVIGFWV